mgnify:CR=1 FL=1
MFAVYAHVANHTYAGKAPEVAGRSSHDDISQTDWWRWPDQGGGTQYHSASPQNHTEPQVDY